MNNKFTENYPKQTICISRKQFLERPETVTEMIIEALKKDNNIRRMNALIYISDN